MSYSIIAAIFLATIALSSASMPMFDQEREAFVRFYSNFAELRRPATQKSFVNQEQTIEQYQFYFTEKEYVRIDEHSLTMFNVDVMDRTITFYPMPNFAVNGSRYFYRRNPTQNYTVEIELINPDDGLFREVNQPDRYFYLPSFADLEYSSQIPVMPYYEVTFLCNATSSQVPLPILSYIDRSLQYTVRYLLDLPSLNSDKPVEMYAYVDIRNMGDLPLVISGAELVAGDINMNRQPFDYTRPAVSYFSYQNSLPNQPRLLGEKSSGTYAFQLSLPSSITIPARSLKSVRFLETTVTIAPFLSYSTVFSPVNSNGKLMMTYNLTSMDRFLPTGRLYLSKEGRFLGQTELPDLSANKPFTMIFDADADVSYRRQVTTVLRDDDKSYSKSYRVEYFFENAKPSRDLFVYFLESFSSLKYFQIENLVTPMFNNNTSNLPNIESQETDLRGYFFLPRQGSPIKICYTLFIYEHKPTISV